MNDNWKKLQKEVITKDKRLNGPFNKARVEAIEDAIKDLTINSHEPMEFTKKLQQLHNKIDSIYTLLETLSNRLNKLDYSGEVTYGEPHHIGRKEKQISVTLSRKEEITSPNPHGEDDFAKPE
jgi:hypothetical protein